MSEIRPSEAEKKSVFTRCLKAQDIADNTLSATTLNILTHTNNHIAPGDAQSLGANYLITRRARCQYKLPRAWAKENETEKV